jgi:hypothetical protein
MPPADAHEVAQRSSFGRVIGQRDTDESRSVSLARCRTARQRNSSPVMILSLRATGETFAPGS